LIARLSSELQTYVGNLFHVVDHLIVALSLLAEPGEKGFAGRLSVVADSEGRDRQPYLSRYKSQSSQHNVLSRKSSMMRSDRHELRPNLEAGIALTSVAIVRD
jgi:hypothetical protein